MTWSQPVEEAVIVGGGLAGAAAACTLAEAGRPVLLIERSTGPHHKVCGEFLSAEAQDYLALLGLDLDTLGASEISSVRIIHGQVCAEADLPFRARGLSRKILDEALLQKASGHGARIRRGLAVRSIVPGESDVCIDCGCAGETRTQALFLATGKHDVRGVKRARVGTRDDMIGFKLHLTLAESQQTALGAAVEIILFPDGYAGLLLVEGKVANLCLLVTRQRFAQIGRRWEDLFAYISQASSHLAARLDGAVAVLPHPLAIFAIPYGFVHAPHPPETGRLFRLGDQAGVIPSFTGDGMSIALHGGRLAASTYLKHGQASSAFHLRLRNDIQRQVQFASLLDALGSWAVGQPTLVRVLRACPAAMQYAILFTRLRGTAIRRAMLTS